MNNLQTIILENKIKIKLYFIIIIFTIKNNINILIKITKNTNKKQC